MTKGVPYRGGSGCFHSCKTWSPFLFEGRNDVVDRRVDIPGTMPLLQVPVLACASTARVPQPPIDIRVNGSIQEETGEVWPSVAGRLVPSTLEDPVNSYDPGWLTRIPGTKSRASCCVLAGSFGKRCFGVKTPLRTICPVQPGPFVA